MSAETSNPGSARESKKPLIYERGDDEVLFDEQPDNLVDNLGLAELQKEATQEDNNKRLLKLLQGVGLSPEEQMSILNNAAINEILSNINGSIDAKNIWPTLEPAAHGLQKRLHEQGIRLNADGSVVNNNAYRNNPLVNPEDIRTIQALFDVYMTYGKEEREEIYGVAGNHHDDWKTDKEVQTHKKELIRSGDLEKLKNLVKTDADVWIKRSDDSWSRGKIDRITHDGLGVMLSWYDSNDQRLEKPADSSVFLNWQDEAATARGISKNSLESAPDQEGSLGDMLARDLTRLGIDARIQEAVLDNQTLLGELHMADYTKHRGELAFITDILAKSVRYLENRAGFTVDDNGEPKLWKILDQLNPFGRKKKLEAAKKSAEYGELVDLITLQEKLKHVSIGNYARTLAQQLQPRTMAGKVALGAAYGVGAIAGIVEGINKSSEKNTLTEPARVASRGPDNSIRPQIRSAEGEVDSDFLRGQRERIEELFKRDSATETRRAAGYPEVTPPEAVADVNSTEKPQTSANSKPKTILNVLPKDGLANTSKQYESERATVFTPLETQTEAPTLIKAEKIEAPKSTLAKKESTPRAKAARNADVPRRTSDRASILQAQELLAAIREGSAAVTKNLPKSKTRVKTDLLYPPNSNPAMTNAGDFATAIGDAAKTIMRKDIDAQARIDAGILKAQGKLGHTAEPASPEKVKAGKFIAAAAEAAAIVTHGDTSETAIQKKVDAFVSGEFGRKLSPEVRKRLIGSRDLVEVGKILKRAVMEEARAPKTNSKRMNDLEKARKAAEALNAADDTTPEELSK